MGPLDVHHSCTSLLSFTFKNNFLNFVNSLEKNISWNVAKTIAQWEISLINLEPRFPEMYSTACDLEFKGDPNWGTITVHWIRACSAVALNRVEDHEWGKVIYPWRDYYGDRYNNKKIKLSQIFQRNQVTVGYPVYFVLLILHVFHQVKEGTLVNDVSSGVSNLANKVCFFTFCMFGILLIYEGSFGSEIVWWDIVQGQN